MSYGVAEALQAAVYGRLAGDEGLAALVGGHVYDAVPEGPVPGLYVVLGAERVQERSDASGRGAAHDFEVSVVTRAAGFSDAKAAAGAVSDLLDGAAPALARGRVVAMRFLRAKARREGTGAVRRIDLTFRALVDDE